jgi:hypothetical protein
MGTPEFERAQIQAVLGAKFPDIRRGVGLHLMSQTPTSRVIFDSAVRPAMSKSGLDVYRVELAFDSCSPLSDVASWVNRGEVITADLSDWNADIAYVLGMCHASGRLPITIARRDVELPFHLAELRCVLYDADMKGMHDLQIELARVLRNFVNSSRAEKRDDYFDVT